MKIHFRGEPGCPSTVQDLYNPQTNAQCAVHILNSQGLNAWQTWSEGKCNGRLFARFYTFRNFPKSVLCRFPSALLQLRLLS